LPAAAGIAAAGDAAIVKYTTANTAPVRTPAAIHPHRAMICRSRLAGVRFGLRRGRLVRSSIRPRRARGTGSPDGRRWSGRSGTAPHGSAQRPRGIVSRRGEQLADRVETCPEDVQEDRAWVCRMRVIYDLRSVTWSSRSWQRFAKNVACQRYGTTALP
jgi:hypothetical protein